MTRRFGWLLALVALTGLGLRIGYVVVVGPHIELGADAIWYQLQAGTLADGVGYVDPDAFYRLGEEVPTANFPPLWPLVLAGAVTVGIDGTPDLQFVGCVLGTVTVVLTGLIGRRLAGPAVGLVAAAVVAVSPSLLAADGSLMTESLYVALITGAVLVALRVADRPTLPGAAALGLVLGAAALTRTDAVIMAAALLGALLWRLRHRPVGQRARLAGAFVGVAALVVLPWVVIASARMDSLVVISNNGGSVLEGANCPSTYSGELIGAWDPACLVETRAAGRSEPEWSAAARDKGVAYATDNVVRWPAVGAVRVLRVFGLWEPIDMAHRDEAVESRSPDWQVLAWAYDLVVLGLAVAGAIGLRRRGVSLAIPASIVAGVVVVVLLSTGNTRFRLVAEPQLAVAAAAFLVATGPRLRSGA